MGGREEGWERRKKEARKEGKKEGAGREGEREGQTYKQSQTSQELVTPLETGLNADIMPWLPLSHALRLSLSKYPLGMCSLLSLGEAK